MKPRKPKQGEPKADPEVDLDAEELEVEGEDDVETEDEPEEEEFEDDDEPEEEVEEEPVPAETRGRRETPREEQVPKARLDDALTRNQVLEGILARFGPGASAAAPTTREGLIEEIVKELPDEEAKKWGRFTGHIAAKVLEKIGGAMLQPRDQAQAQLSAQVQEAMLRMKHGEEYDEYSQAAVVKQREWYNTTGQVFPLEHAYVVVRGEAAMKQSANDRTRSRRRQPSMRTVGSGGGAGPARKRTKSAGVHMPTTMREVEGLDWKQAMKILDREKIRI